MFGFLSRRHEATEAKRPAEIEVEANLPGISYLGFDREEGGRMFPGVETAAEARSDQPNEDQIYRVEETGKVDVGGGGRMWRGGVLWGDQVIQ